MHVKEVLPCWPVCRLQSKWSRKNCSLGMPQNKHPSFQTAVPQTNPENKYNTSWIHYM